MINLRFIFLILSTVAFSSIVLASSSSSSLDKELLSEVTAKIHRVSLLLADLVNKGNPHFRRELNTMSLNLAIFDSILFSRYHMALWCDDPMKKYTDKEILLAAYQRDTVCPFHETFKLEHMPQLKAYGINTVTELGKHPSYIVLIDDIKRGDLKFIPNYYFSDYSKYLKNISSKYFIQSVERDLKMIFEMQTGRKPEPKDNITGSSQGQLNYHRARVAFITLHETDFMQKK